MPLSLPAMNVAIVCEGRELETFDVKQDGTTSHASLTASMASEAGKQFKITFSNNLPNLEVAIFLHVDGRLVQSVCLQAWSTSEILGPYSNAHSILPFKFQELQLVDPDLEDAPAAPEMGTIELKAYRCRTRYVREPSKQPLYENLHRGRVSERSKKAGWHHIATGDEIPVSLRPHEVEVDYLDPWGGPPCASVKIFYRPRELLRAQGIIPANDVAKQGPQIKNKKRAREDRSPGPSRTRPKIKVKSEEFSGNTRLERIRALQAELDALKAAEQSGTSIKHELRSPSPVVDLTLDD